MKTTPEDRGPSGFPRAHGDASEDASRLATRVLYDRDGILVVDKWPGIPTSGRTLEDTDCIQWHLLRLMGAMVWAVHQLDADTSGVNLFTSERALVAPLKGAMAHGEAEKRYTAIVAKVPPWDAITAIGAIGPIGDGGSLGMSPTGRPARSEFHVTGRSADGTAALVDARLYTGRTHQLRIHLAALGHPLVGEEWYGTGEGICAEPEQQRARRGHPRQALHARRLALGPPFSCAFEAPLAGDLVALARSLRLSAAAGQRP